MNEWRRLRCGWWRHQSGITLRFRTLGDNQIGQWWVEVGNRRLFPIDGYYGPVDDETAMRAAMHDVVCYLPLLMVHQ